MAVNSDQREQNYEAKYLRKMLSQVDEQIPVPDSVRAAALRSKLDNIYPTKAAAPNKKSGLRLNWSWLSLQSGFSYAAAFVLIVTLFYGLGFNQPTPTIVDGSIAAENAATQQAESVTQDAQTPGVFADSPDQSAKNTAMLPASVPDASTQGDSGAADSSTVGGAPVSGFSAETSGGVGGGSVTLASATFDGYHYTWRTNDPTDPDKAQFPITLDIAEAKTQRLEAQIDIPDMHSVQEYHYEAGLLSMVGEGEEGIVTRVYRMEMVASPVELMATVNPGKFVAFRVRKGVLHTVTYSPDAAAADGVLPENVVQLPSSLEQGVCIVTAADLAAGTWQQMAFTGAGEDIDLQNLNLYIGYMGEPLELEIDDEPKESSAKDQEMHFAQIRFDGQNMTLGGVS